MKDKGFIIVSSKMQTVSAVSNLISILEKENPKAFILVREEEDPSKLENAERVLITSELKTINTGQYLGYYFECESK